MKVAGRVPGESASGIIPSIMNDRFRGGKKRVGRRVMIGK
jgi:hypothetical protein